MTLLNSKELFERVRRALKNMGAENHDIESYISNLEDVLLGEESTNKSLKATFNSLSDKAKSELSLAMNTTEPVVSDTAVGELVKAIQDPKQVERVAASIEHAASNAPATLESVVARAEKRLPGLTAANRQVLIDEIKATEIPGTGKYKYTNKNLADFEEAYLRKTSRERLKQVARDAKTVGAPQVIEATKPSATELHIQAVTAKNPEMGAFLREAANKADLAGAPVELDALKRLQRIAAGGKGLTLKEQGDLIEAARTAESAATGTYVDVLPPGTPFEKFTRAGVKQPRLPIPQEQALARVIPYKRPLEVANNIEEAGIYHTLKNMASAEKTAATMSPDFMASMRRIGTPAAAELAGTGPTLFNETLRGVPQTIGTIVPKAAMATEAAAASAPGLLRRVAGGASALAAAHPILSTAAFIGGDLLAANELSDFTAPAVESAQFDTQLRARDSQALNQLPIDVALRAAAAKNYVSPWEQAMEGRQTMQQMQQQAAARDTHRNAMGLAPGDSIL